jgi:hypothetical protein
MLFGHRLVPIFKVSSEVSSCPTARPVENAEYGETMIKIIIDTVIARFLFNSYYLN